MECCFAAETAEQRHQISRRENLIAMVLRTFVEPLCQPLGKLDPVSLLCSDRQGGASIHGVPPVSRSSPHALNFRGCATLQRSPRGAGIHGEEQKEEQKEEQMVPWKKEEQKLPSIFPFDDISIRRFRRACLGRSGQLTATKLMPMLLALRRGLSRRKQR